MSIVDRIKTLASEKGLSIAELERNLGFGNNIISKWDKSVPRSDKLKSLADYFNVSTDYLLGRTTYKGIYEDPLHCPLCGLGYIPSVPSDVKLHDQYHAKYSLAVNKFGDLIGDAATRDEIKTASRQTIESDSKTLDEKYDAFIKLYFCQFSRSVMGSDWSLEHVDFPTYLSMILNQESVRKYLPPDLYKRAVSEFGTKDGIESGKTYYKIPDNIKQKSTILDSYNKLDKHGKAVINSVLELELKRVENMVQEESAPYYIETAAAHHKTGVYDEADHRDIAKMNKIVQKINEE